jgi:hypothetical protein
MMPFYTKNDLHFTKTGSGQTYGKITKNMLFLTVRLRSIQVRKQERKKENKLGFSSAQNNCPLLSQVDLPRQTRDRAQSEGIDTEHAVVVGCCGCCCCSHRRTWLRRQHEYHQQHLPSSEQRPTRGVRTHARRKRTVFSLSRNIRCVLILSITLDPFG